MIIYILILLIVILISYCIGLLIVNIVDKKLDNITIKIPKQDINIKIDKENNEEIIENFDNHIYSDNQKKIESKNNPIKYEMSQPDIFRKNDNICIKNHVHKGCNYGVTNYQDPKDMSYLDRNLFKISYPKNLTLQDYVNWLWIYKNEPSKLSEEHLNNFNKIKKGKMLKYESGITPPAHKQSPGLSSHKDFEKNYKQFTQLENKHLNVNSSNYENFDEYSKFNASTLFKMTTPQLSNPNRIIHIPISMTKNKK